MNKPGKKDSRNSKTPPEKKRAKTLEQPSSPVQEEPEPVSCVLQGDEIQALAIKLEDLAKLRTAHHPQEKKEKPTVTKKYLIRRSKPQEVGKKANFLVAYPTVPDESKKTLNYSGTEGPVVDIDGYILPHSILGTLQEFKEEALRRGHRQVAKLIPEESQLSCAISVLGKFRKEHEEAKPTPRLSSQHLALQNWDRYMAIRKQQQKKLCDYLEKTESDLVMNSADNYRKIQEERTLIDRSLCALYPGKGCHAGNEFWNEPIHIGDELSGLAVTLGQTERGFPEDVTHVGRPHSIWMEMGTRPPRRRTFHLHWEDGLFLKQRRNELKEILEKLDFYSPDLDGLEVVGRNRPFTNVSSECFVPSDEVKECVEEGKSQDPLEEYPDVFSEPVVGPSVKFCGQPARWINTISHKGEVGIAARITFEILVGEKAESRLIVSNDGTTAIWYDWRRLPQPFTFQEKKMKKTQNFYFNTRSGVILPGETRKFSFIFKSMNAGIFSESWEFGTHPMLLGGALLQVTLWGIAIYEDISSEIRDELERNLDTREVAVIVKENLKELLDRIRTPERTRSPLDAYVTEEELFHRKNPQLHYKHQVIKGLHELWDKLMNPPQVMKVYSYESTGRSFPSESSLLKSGTSSRQKSPDDPSQLRNVSPTLSGVRKSVPEVTSSQLSGSPVEEVNQVEEVTRVEWNLSIPDFKQTLLTVSEEEEREAALAHLNRAALELCTISLKTQEDLMYHICFQLWREVIDGLVSHSLVLRSLLGMPEKNTYAEAIPEEPAEVKSVVIKAGREDRKVQKEDKKVVTKEKEKEKAKSSKEERLNVRKAKSKDEKKSRVFTKEAKEAISFVLDSAEEEPQAVPQEQVDPVVQEKYHEKLYVEVYGLLNSMMSKMVFLFEELKKDSLEMRTSPPFV